MEKNRPTVIYDKVSLKHLPKLSDLDAQVQDIVRKSSWFELYGFDWCVCAFSLLMVPFALVILQGDSWIHLSVGALLYGWIHTVLATKCGHAAAHGALLSSTRGHRLLSVIFVELIGTFSEELAYDIHIKTHHPYTNIIGLGDSSTWKAPFIPAFIYMFITPLAVPLLAPVLSIAGLAGKWLKLLRFLIIAGLGLSLNLFLLMKVSGFSLLGAIFMTWIARGIWSIPYIHVNIFQHIGLPMYSRESKPKRIYQMATGVLNLFRNPLLDYAFGHSIINCHVEHHLFPKLSDNMCLKIKPVVTKFLKENGLPYNEDSYMGRLWLFLDKYKELMVHAPPITHFVGLQ
ncbi:hypothetical protein ACJMK2_006237 [Sinanodonta woodiana]|uniref:Fatty acid desaturase domain-containing protein n=1 Tax=Sinanodonta woodiana TaxID=1069815 RepID=A0ABD3VSZ6_SINWO